MPSMRLLHIAGVAAEKTNVCAYNCSYVAPTKWQDFAEIMYISMCGTGCGWSAESQISNNFLKLNFKLEKDCKVYHS